MRKLPNKLIYKRNSFYHIYNRGNHKQKIFLREKDYKVFKNQMYKYAYKHNVYLISYCFMPNHYHLIVKCGKNLQSVPKFMQGFSIAYVLYFNHQHKKVGRLFQSPFQVRRLTGIRDLNSMIAYLKHNPLEADLVGGASLESYRWFYLRSTTQKLRRKRIEVIDECMMNEGEV